jgi:uncharacterized membrane protein
MTGDMLEENASMRSGETVGEGALDMWRRRASFAEQSRDWLKTLLWLAVAAFVGWFLWRNRHSWKERGIVRGLMHAVLGGSVAK